MGDPAVQLRSIDYNAAPNPSSDLFQSKYEVVRRLRASQRITTRVQALLKCERWTQSVEIRNISQTGAGLRGGHDMRWGEALTLQLSDGRMLLAEVQWCRMGFCGIKFDAPLSINDPIFGGKLIKAKYQSSSQDQSIIIAMPGLSAGATQWANIGSRGSETWAKVFRQTVPNDSFIRRMMSYFFPNSRDVEIKMVERACRKQGFSWLAQESPTADDVEYERTLARNCKRP